MGQRRFQTMSDRISVDVLKGREAIYQATGIIMVRRACSSDAAIDFLLDEAERQHCTVQAVAAAVVGSVRLKNAP